MPMNDFERSMNNKLLFTGPALLLIVALHAQAGIIFNATINTGGLAQAKAIEADAMNGDNTLSLTQITPQAALGGTAHEIFSTMGRIYGLEPLSGPSDLQHDLYRYSATGTSAAATGAFNAVTDTDQADTTPVLDTIRYDLAATPGPATAVLVSSFVLVGFVVRCKRKGVPFRSTKP